MVLREFSFIEREMYIKSDTFIRMSDDNIIQQYKVAALFTADCLRLYRRYCLFRHDLFPFHSGRGRGIDPEIWLFRLRR